MRGVVVTGLGAVCALGLRAKEVFQKLLLGKSVARQHNVAPEKEPPFLSLCCQVPTNFDPVGLFGKRDANRMDRFVQFACAASEEAFSDAQIANIYEKDRVAVVLGSGFGGLQSLFAAEKVFREKGARWIPPFTVPKVLSSMASGWVSIRLACHGPNLAPATACAASAHAITQAAHLIESGYADAAIAGGAEAPLHPVSVASFDTMRALSKQAAKPFDTARNGFLLGEGGAALLLEEEESAKKRGARIYAKLTGWGISADAYHLTAPDKEGDGCFRAMKLALKHAKLSTVDYINAHATGTRAGDLAETKAIQTLFGQTPIVTSTKGASGHLLGAAGALEAVISILALQENIVPPTVGLENVDPACQVNHVLKQARHIPLHTVLSNSMGFGGTNASLVFSRLTG